MATAVPGMLPAAAAAAVDRVPLRRCRSSRRFEASRTCRASSNALTLRGQRAGIQVAATSSTVPSLELKRGSARPRLQSFFGPSESAPSGLISAAEVLAQATNLCSGRGGISQAAFRPDRAASILLFAGHAALPSICSIKPTPEQSLGSKRLWLAGKKTTSCLSLIQRRGDPNWFGRWMHGQDGKA